MLQVKTRVRQSAIAGVGLFADEDIKEGTVIWQFSKYTTNTYTEQEWNKFKSEVSKITFQGIDKYVHFHEGKWHLNIDDTRFINHSSNPNASNDTEKGICYALFDIKCGDEITVDYSELCKCESEICATCGVCKLD